MNPIDPNEHARQIRRANQAEAERDALRAEVERLREQNDVQAEELSGWRNAHTNFASRCVGCVFAARLVRAAQSLYRAWKRERAEVERLTQAERWARAEVESLRIIMSQGRYARLLRATQSLYRAWKREKDIKP